MGLELSLKVLIEKERRENLKVVASHMGFHSLSKLRKAELVDLIYGKMLEPEYMFYKLAILDDRCIELFEAAAEGRLELRKDNYGCLARVMECSYTALSDTNDVRIPDDAIKVWESIKGEKFDAYRKRASWVFKCFFWCDAMYGFFPVKNCLDVINVRGDMKMEEEELLSIYKNFTYDQNEFILLKDGFISGRLPFREDDPVTIIKLQGDKPYYVPTEKEVEEFYYEFALTSGKEYREMRKFLKDTQSLDDEKIDDILAQLFMMINDGVDHNEFIQWFFDQIDIDDGQLNKVLGLLMKLSNGTRTLINRGYTPDEMARIRPIKPGMRPRIVAQSSEAAKMLSEAAPRLKGLGLDVDLDYGTGSVPVFGFPDGIKGEMVKTERKIYPNDPCPCGSGKKYKKCCGRNI